MSLAESILFGISRRRIQRAGQAPAAAKGRGTKQDYDAWREAELRKHLCGNFDLEEVRGRHVLDFGCGTGALAFHLIQLGAARVLGVDLSPDLVDRARARARQEGLAAAAFRVARNPGRIDCRDESFDLICCFDVLEHVMFPGRVVGEWRRVLRPEGKVWIWWSHWRSPYGHHLASLVPVPWAHVLVSERTLINVAARVYDDPCFVPRGWHVDSHTGEKLPNKWRMGSSLSSGLNKLTLARFQAACKCSDFSLRLRPHGFSSTAVRRRLRWMAHLPGLGEYFTSYYTAVLQKAGAGERLRTPASGGQPRGRR